MCSPTDTPDKCFSNYREFVSSGLEFNNDLDSKIFGFIEEFAGEFGAVPNYASVHEHFSDLDDFSVIDRLANLENEKPLYKGDFVLRVEKQIKAKKRQQVNELFNQSSQILTTGIKIKEGREERILRGPTDAIQFIMDHGHEIVAPPRSEKLYGNVSKDIDAAKAEYLKRKNEPNTGVGALTGITTIDRLGGAKRKELWTHAAFTGGLKSTFAINWLYTQAIHYGNSVMMLSLEMPYDQCRRLLLAMHSIHDKFRNTRMELGIQRDPNVDVGLSYSNIRDGRLNAQEEKYYLDYVLEDFTHNTEDYGGLHIHEADPNKTKFTVVDIRHKAEAVYAQDPIEMMVVDHAGLLDPVKNYHSTTECQNEVMRNLKKLALGFNSGQGLGVVGLYQINREGFKSAQKNGGKYNLTHLSYANEAEKSSDIVTAGYIDDELRKKNQLFFQCLKSRDNAPFDDFYMRVEWPCRRLYECDGHELTQEDAEMYGDEADLISYDDIENIL